MPKIFGTSWLAVIIATVVFYLIGFLWYGFLFPDIWLAASGMTEAEAMARNEEMGAMMFVWGLLISLGQAVGVLMVIHLAGAKRVTAALKWTFWLVVTIVMPILAYASLYSGYSLNGYLVDASHLLVGYLAMAAIYAAFRGKGAVDA